MDAATLAIDLGPRFASYRSTAQAARGHASDLELLPPPSETTTTVFHPACAHPTTLRVPAPPAELRSFAPPGLAIRTVTLDPGHGGTDTGTRGPAADEKTVTPTVARRVKASLEARLGLRVLLTREDDHDVPFDARAAVANNNKADLFISLRQRRVPTDGIRRVGAGRFIPHEGQVRQSLEPQRVPVFGGGLRDIELVLWNQAQIPLRRSVQPVRAYARRAVPEPRSTGYG